MHIRIISHTKTTFVQKLTQQNLQIPPTLYLRSIRNLGTFRTEPLQSSAFNGVAKLLATLQASLEREARYCHADSSVAPT